jgi:hypothetical protein
MTKTKKPDTTFEQFEQAGPDIKMLADRVRMVENSGVRNTLLRAIQVLLGKPIDSEKEGQE